MLFFPSDLDQWQRRLVDTFPLRRRLPAPRPRLVAAASGRSRLSTMVRPLGYLRTPRIIRCTCQHQVQLRKKAGSRFQAALWIVSAASSAASADSTNEEAVVALDLMKQPCTMVVKGTSASLLQQPHLQTSESRSLNCCRLCLIQHRCSLVTPSHQATAEAVHSNRLLPLIADHSVHTTPDLCSPAHTPFLSIAALPLTIRKPARWTPTSRSTRRSKSSF